MGPSRLWVKSDSPSCGMERVRIYAPSGMPTRNGIGPFARELLQHFPELPIEEEGRLSDPRLRENWIQRVFAYHRLRILWESKWTVGDLVELYTAHKLVLLAHSPKAFTDLGRLVAGAEMVKLLKNFKIEINDSSAQFYRIGTAR